MTTIMAIDPGGTSGYAILRFPKADVVVVAGRVNGKKDMLTHQFVKMCKDQRCLEWGEVKGAPDDQAVALFQLAIEHDVTVLIIESFYLDAPLSKKVRTADILMPVKVAWGVVALMRQARRMCQIVWQPSSSMTVITDERLRRWNLWIPGKKDARAALKHLLVYLRGDPTG